MSLNKLFVYVISVVTTLVCFLLMDTSLYETVSIFLSAYFIFNFIDSIGKSYNVLDIPILFTLFQCLIMPMVIYREFNDDYFTIALRYDMTVSEERYYGFMLPAIIMMIVGMKLPLDRFFKTEINYSRFLKSSKEYLQGKGSAGLLLIIIGLVAGILQVFAPGELGYLMYLINKLFFVGIFYILFSEFKNKYLYVGGGVVILFAQTIATGMFGELVYTLLLAFLLLALGRNYSLRKKIGLSALGFVFVLLMQSIKSEFRRETWVAHEVESKSSTFLNLVVERLQNPFVYSDKYEIFPIVVRFNQGMIVGKVLDYVPNRVPFYGGETIATSLAASFVPRVLWPEKPIAGGKLNMEQFTGLIIEGYSMNVSPFGEAYANFGETEGIIFMFIYGLFFNVVIFFLSRKAIIRPTIVLWFPILFINSIQIETDILMTVNSLLKSLLFMAFCYWAADRFLRLKL